MTLADELAQLEISKRNSGGTRCRIAVIVEALDAKDAAAVHRLLDATDVYGSQIATLLQSHGHRVNAGHIGHHRRRLKGSCCSCPVAAS